MAILFVTKNFLSSEFCRLEEVPVMLQRARQGKLTVLPLLADPCSWKNYAWLSPRQMWPRDDKALCEHNEPGSRSRVMTEFADQVLAAVNAPAAGRKVKASFDAPDRTFDLHRLPQTGSLLFGRTD